MLRRPTQNTKIGVNWWTVVVLIMIIFYRPWHTCPVPRNGETFLFALQCIPEYDGTQNFKRYRYRYFFPVPDIYDTDTGTFFRYQIFPIPVPGLFSGTKFYRYRFRDFFPVPIFSDTCTDTTRKKLTIPLRDVIPKKKSVFL